MPGTRLAAARVAALQLIVAFAGACTAGDSGLPTPALPDTLFAYSAIRNPLPRHFIFDLSGSAMREDNTPPDNQTTDAGATLGRVLFYDVQLSENNRVSCGSCHQQRFGFSDTARFSVGARGQRTRRHTMALANARFYSGGRFFRDERAPSLEELVLQPVHDTIEMALPRGELTSRLRRTPYYAPLFAAAFGTSDITDERVARALAQFVRALVSTSARLDSIFRGGGPPNELMLTADEREGRRLFSRPNGCGRCHRTNALELDLPDNIGLDSAGPDRGAGDGKFKTSSLRNIAVRPPYMHDGRFKTLEKVVDFYDHGVKNDPHLDLRLRGLDGTPLQLGLSPAQRQALVAYLRTFSDRAFLADVRFSDPFGRPVY